MLSAHLGSTYDQLASWEVNGGWSRLMELCVMGVGCCTSLLYEDSGRVEAHPPVLRTVVVMRYIR